MIPESCPLNDKYKLRAKLHQKCIAAGTYVNKENLCADCYYYKQTLDSHRDLDYAAIKKKMAELMKERGLPNFPIIINSNDK